MFATNNAKRGWQCSDASANPALSTFPPETYGRLLDELHVRHQQNIVNAAKVLRTIVPNDNLDFIFRMALTHRSRAMASPYCSPKGVFSLDFGPPSHRGGSFSFWSMTG